MDGGGDDISEGFSDHRIGNFAFGVFDRVVKQADDLVEVVFEGGGEVDGVKEVGLAVPLGLAGMGVKHQRHGLFEFGAELGWGDSDIFHIS